MDINSLIGYIENNLRAKGYEISGNVQYGDLTYLTVGHLTKFEFSRFGISDYFFPVGYLIDPTLENIKTFSSQSYSYAKNKRKNKLPAGLFGGFWTFPIIIVDHLDDSVSQIIENDCPPKHWASFEFLIVVEASTGKVKYYRGTPVWGALYYKNFRKLADEITTFK